MFERSSERGELNYSAHSMCKMLVALIGVFLLALASIGCGCKLVPYKVSMLLKQPGPIADIRYPTSKLSKFPLNNFIFYIVHIQYMIMCIIHYHALLIWACQSPMWFENYESQEDTIQWLKCLTRWEFKRCFLWERFAKNDVLPEALPLPFRHVSFADLESSWRKVRACHAKELETGPVNGKWTENARKTWKKQKGKMHTNVWNVSNWQIWLIPQSCSMFMSLGAIPFRRFATFPSPGSTELIWRLNLKLQLQSLQLRHTSDGFILKRKCSTIKREESMSRILQMLPFSYVLLIILHVCLFLLCILWQIAERFAVQKAMSSFRPWCPSL